ncbi:MAG: hypothetical protein JRI36_07275 [Deltaproteobacteria bacterium]|nr:hypothetical protein [Deltaproteobacteria bacterium]
MNTVLQESVDAVSAGTQTLKRELFLMERPATSDENGTEKDTLDVLARRVMRLEFEVAGLMSTYLSLSYQYPAGQTSQVLDDLWGVFVALDDMYRTINGAQQESSTSMAIHPAQVKQLQLVWVKLNKKTRQASKQLAEVRLLSHAKRYAIH